MAGHRPVNCEMFQTWGKKLKSESQNVKWIQANTKECPRCRKFIEKNQGCNHMTCRKEAGGCGHEFCWLCFADWNKHKDCNKFVDQNTTNRQNESKIELQRYMFYYDRFNNHDKALVLGIRMRNSMDYFVQLFNELKGVPIEELYFLREGVEGIIKGRNFLKYTYVFGYYILDSKKKEKALFEHTQSLLEKNCDMLHEFLENETMRTILALIDYGDFTDEFKKFKNLIIDLNSATIKFLTNLLNDMENNMLHLIDPKRLSEK